MRLAGDGVGGGGCYEKGEKKKKEKGRGFSFFIFRIDSQASSVKHNGAIKDVRSWSRVASKLHFMTFEGLASHARPSQRQLGDRGMVRKRRRKKKKKVYNPKKENT